MRLLTLLFLLTLSFAGTASESVTVKLIQQKLDRQPPLCLGITQWPVVTDADDSVYISARMAALVDAGLARYRSLAGKNQWQLTPYGSKEFSKHHDFCYGRIVVTSTKQIDDFPHCSGTIVFQYTIEALPAWSKNKSMRFAWSEMDNLITGIDGASFGIKFSRHRNGRLELTGEAEQRDLFY